MRRTTIALPDSLQATLERYQQDQSAPPSTSALVQAALREYLERRGYTQARPSRGLRLTPAEHGSGSADASRAHDRYVAEAAARR